jgi:hypothetical protein
MKALLRDTVNQGIERLSEHEMNNLIDIPHPRVQLRNHKLLPHGSL